MLQSGSIKIQDIPGLTQNPSYKVHSTKENKKKSQSILDFSLSQNPNFHIKTKGKIICDLVGIQQNKNESNLISDKMDISKKNSSTNPSPERYKYGSRFSQYFQSQNSSQLSPKCYVSKNIQTEIDNKSMNLKINHRQFSNQEFHFSSDSDSNEMIITSSSDSENFF